MQTLFSVLLLASSVGIIVSTFFQEGEDGMAALGGHSPSLFGKNKAATTEASLQRITVVSGVIFMISALVLATY